MKIIDSNISGTYFHNLIHVLKGYIEESINTACNEEIIDYYRGMTIDDYYSGGYEDIWNENDELIGSGVRAIFADFVMNENTRPDLEKAFIIARDQAFKEYDERAIELLKHMTMTDSREQ